MTTSIECPRTPSPSTGAPDITQRPADAPSTPLRVSTWKQILRSPSSAAHVKFAQDAYECTTWDVDVHDFVQGVFRLDWSDILQEPREGSGKQYQQSVSEVQRFLEASKEAKTCGSNFELMNALSSQLYRTCGQKETICAMGRRKASENHAKNPGGKVLMPTYRGKVGIRTGEAVGEHCLKETLDLTYDKGEISIPRWEWAVAPMVMGAKGLSEALLKDGGGMFVALDDPGIPRAMPDDEAHMEDMLVGESQSKKPQAQPRRPLPAGFARQSQGPSSNPGTQRVSGTGPTGSKRQHETEEQRSTEPSSKRARTSKTEAARDITETELRFLKYLNETMSRNIRSYTIGWLVENDTLRLAYGDCMGVVLTKPIEFLGKDAILFSLVVAAMGAATEHGLGIHPNVHWPRLGDNPDEQHEVATLRLEGQGEDCSEVLDYEFDVDKKAHRSVCTEFGFIGWGTTVMRARLGAVASVQTREELIAKVAWPHAARTAEDVFIRKVRSRLKAAEKKKIFDHIVDLKAAMTKGMEAMDLPRHAMGLCPEEQDLRVCRILILKCYRPLDAIGSQAEFHQVFVRVVRAHYWAYETSKVLHCNISMTSIMWFRRGEDIVGMLCDWDLAEDHGNGGRRAVDIGQSDAAALSGQGQGKIAPSRQQSEHKASPLSNVEQLAPVPEKKVNPRYRTGTGPFMALDFLRQGIIPAHKYRHDLESFFYVYACAAATYDPNDEPKICIIKQWNDPELVKIGHHKRAFLEDGDQVSEVFQNVHPDFEEVVKSSLRELWFLFCEVEALANEGKITKIRLKHAGNNVVEAALDAIERQRVEIASYEKFMEILSAQSHHSDVPT
ncbi:hypothetical protein FOMPIDRAFT_92699 [Fomitopsis schrenkii]|uniref:Fungal-type protein kinase domain-containing protein n=1 Tax=Fomitopsis schrenkii TaxID=2126942 RepID=S8FWC4_FOMSC|nr:hypothetical protein FOMPIDRAFT_92699 [Fomitopsis schrenkii]